MKRAGSIVFLISLLATAGAANAFVLSNVDGDWGGWTGGFNVVTPSGQANPGYGNQSQDQIRWGRLWTPGLTTQSGLGFTGCAGSGVTLSFGLDEVFEIGELEHFNRPIDPGTHATSVQLTLHMTFIDPAGLSEDLFLQLHVDETINDPGSVDDVASVAGSFPTISFTAGGQEYTLNILGFGPDSGSIGSQLQSAEGANSLTHLWGQIAGPANPSIPAPGAVLLAGLGAVAVGVLRRRRAL